MLGVLSEDQTGPPTPLRKKRKRGMKSFAVEMGEDNDQFVDETARLW